MNTIDTKPKTISTISVHDRVFSQQFGALLRDSGMNTNSQRLYLQLLNQEIREKIAREFPTPRNQH